MLTRAEQSALDSTNRARQKAGCPDLRVDARLTMAARVHSTDMREHRYYSHTNPGGEGPAERAQAAGYHAYVEENIARGLLGGSTAVTNWMLSAETRDRITNCEFTAVGIGAHTALLNSWWTQVLGTR